MTTKTTRQEPATTQHTPTPWKAEKARTLIHITGERQGVCSISISVNHVHEDYPGCKADYIARQEANAAFIVKAANCHDELIHVVECALSKDGTFVGWEKKARAIMAKVKASS